MPTMYIKISIWSGFEIENGIEDQFQSSPKLVGIWTVLRCIFVPNLEIVTSIGGELWHAQAQHGVNFDFDRDLQGQIELSRSNWTPIIPQNNRPLNQGLLHLWSKFGDPSLNGWRIITRTNSWLTDTQTHIHAGNDNTRRPKLASGKNPKKQVVNCFQFSYLCLLIYQCAVKSV